MPGLISKASKLFSLHLDNEEEVKVIEAVKRNVEFSGTNLWVLMLAIFIASIGLNVNSTAVIIGAMLISPLMGPIVGAGMALGINDFQLLKKSILNLLIASLIGAAVSSIYFLISPLSDASSELLSRTNPTIYDVLIALFGGLAGIVGASRVEKGNVIPGVAIATALMPPLCTVGYGIATLQSRFIFGGGYLYLINCTFICLATLAIVRYLKYPSVSFLNRKESNRIRSVITFISLLMIIPAAYLAFQFVRENRFRRNVNQFLDNHFEKNGNTVVFKKSYYYSTPKKIEIAVLDKRYTPYEIDSLQTILDRDYYKDTRLFIKQSVSEFTGTELKKMMDALGDNETKIKLMEDQLLLARMATRPDLRILFREITALYPSISNLSMAQTISRPPTDSLQSLLPITNQFIIETAGNSDSLNTEVKLNIVNWFRIRLNDSLLEVNFATGIR
jgi:uncharacterized hydrophobic protein (TIGR00271 family)